MRGVESAGGIPLGPVRARKRPANARARVQEPVTTREPRVVAPDAARAAASLSIVYSWVVGASVCAFGGPERESGSSPLSGVNGAGGSNRRSRSSAVS